MAILPMGSPIPHHPLKYILSIEYPGLSFKTEQGFVPLYQLSVTSPVSSGFQSKATEEVTVLSLNHSRLKQCTAVIYYCKSLL
jgi:hypothetical protein